MCDSRQYLKNILLLVLCVQDAKVTRLGTVPSLVRTWKASGCMANLDWSSIRFGSVHYLPILQLTKMRIAKLNV